MTKKGNVLLIVLIISAIVGISAAGFWWWSTYFKTTADKQNFGPNYTKNIALPKEKEVTSSGETSNLKTFINFFGNYIIKYSGDDSVGSTCGGELIHFHPPDDCNDITVSELRINVLSNPPKWSLERYVGEIEKRTSVEQKSNLLVAGQKAIALTLTSSLPDGPYFQGNGEIIFGGSAIRNKVKAIYLQTPNSEFMRITYDLSNCPVEKTSLGVKELPCNPKTIEDIKTAESSLSTLKFFPSNELSTNIEKYWLKYRDEIAGFELSYPSDWIVDKNATPSTAQNYFVFRWDDGTPASGKLEPFETRYHVDFSLLIADQKQDLTKIGNKVFPNGYEAKKLKEIKVAGEKAIEGVLEPKDLGTDDFMKAIFFNHLDKSWTITFYYNPHDDYSDPEFLQMLSSFKFL